MEFLKCKACGSVGMVPMDVDLLDEANADDADDNSLELRDYLSDTINAEGRLSEDSENSTDEESRFYSCHVCGDNWLSIRRSDDRGKSNVTFIHQMGVEPVLRRVAHLQTEIVANERTVDHWEYYLDEDEVAESEWMDQLEDRRKVLRAICSN